MEPIDFVGGLRRSWRLLVALAIVGAVIAVLVPTGHPVKKNNKFKFQASSIVGAAPAGGGSSIGGGVSGAQIQFYAETLPVQIATQKAAGLDAPTYFLPYYLSATLVDTTTPTAKSLAKAAKVKKASLVELTGKGKTKLEAQRLADAYAIQVGLALDKAALARQEAAAEEKSGSSNSAPVQTPDQSTAAAATGYQILHFSPEATRSSGSGTTATSSRKVRGLIGLILGLAIGAAIVLLRELLDKHLRTAARAQSTFGYPVVVEIPGLAVTSKVSAPGVAVDVVNEPDSAGAEAYRMLRMSVLFEQLAAISRPGDDYNLDLQNGLAGSLPPAMAMEPLPIGRRQIVLVVSPGSEATRPQVVANLAAVYAEANQKVVVLSTGEVETGSGRALSGDIRPEDVAARLVRSRLDNVSRLPLGSLIGNSGQLVTRAPAVLEALRNLADVVFVETPPMLLMHHAEALSRSVDVVLVVGECGTTTFSEARQAGDLLRRMEAPVLGVVLTNIRVSPREAHRREAHRPADSKPSDPGNPDGATSPSIGPAIPVPEVSAPQAPV